jgi:hypothetical protein
LEVQGNTAQVRTFILNCGITVSLSIRQILLSFDQGDIIIDLKLLKDQTI